jgi:alkane 1-monooxygenase
MFVATGPHAPWMSLAGVALVVVITWVDTKWKSAEEPRAGASWPFTLLIVVLALIQLSTIVLLVRMVHGFRWDLFFIGWFVGNNSGWGTIVIAHELIHRREKPLQWLGRALLVTVLYDHFYVEHLRGHHPRVATVADPATARFGEGYHAFFKRTVREQFASAWKLGRRQVLTGILVELAMLAAIAFFAGWAALVVFLWQAYNAICLLEAVNYFEHWGLTRTGSRPGSRDAWDTDSTFTLYTLIGLSRHADHHAHAARPFQQLRRVEESPKLPYGYYAMVTLAQMRNRRFQELMVAELQRRQLGPFQSTVGEA